MMEENQFVHRVGVVMWNLLSRRPHVRVALFGITLGLAAGNVSAAGFAPKEGFSKAVIGHLMALPNATAPANLVTDIAGDLLDDYQTATLAYIPSAAALRLISAASAVGVEVSVRDDYDRVFLPGGIVDTRIGVERSNPGKSLSGSYREGETGVFIVQFRGPVMPAWLQQVTALGGKPIQYLRYNAFIVAATPQDARAIERLPVVQYTDVLHTFLKPQAVNRTPGESDDLYIQIANATGADKAVDEIGALSITPIERTNAGDEITVRGTFDGMYVDVLLSNPIVYGVAAVPSVALSDERVALSITRNVSFAGVPTNPTKYLDWLREVCPYCTTLQDDGFWIGFADTGLDGGICAGASHHAALPLSRIRYGASFDNSGYEATCPSPPDPPNTRRRNDSYGHGTAVVGIAAGDSTATMQTDSGGFYFATGVAPSAGIFMTKIFPRLAPLSPNIPDTWQLTSDARYSSPPVFIQNHSYNQYQTDNTVDCGNPDLVLYDGKYSILSRNFDRAIRDANVWGAPEPITLTVSSGNQHQQDARFATCTDRRLTLPPATAKNVIAVGGAESVRDQSEQWQCSTTWSGAQTPRAESFNNVESDSKRGTSNGAWVKPDLMAPVSLIEVPIATTVGSMSDPCPAAPDSPPYWPSVGTSYAAPAAAGAALLASRMYAELLRSNCHSSASCDAGAATPALLKAMLIMSARSMLGGDDRAIAPQWQRNHTYTMGQAVTATSGNGHVYTSTAGESGDTEPTWPETGSVPDHTVTWTASGSSLIGKLPNGQQGFGRLHLEDLLSAYPAKDFVNEDPQRTLSSLQAWAKTYAVHDPTLPVKVVLAWTDIPALEDEGDTSTATTSNPLINNLNLSVDIGSPCTVRYVGNRTAVIELLRGEESESAACTDVAYDTTNNVEIVKFFPDSRGQFTVRVTAAEGAAPQNFALAVYNGYAADAGPPPTVPSGFKATGSSTGAVTLSWDITPGATGYEIQRRSGSPFFSATTTVAAPPYIDYGVAPSTAHVYRIRARNAVAVSQFVSDLATTVEFSDVPILQAVTTVKATHIGELRLAVNLVRAAVQLPPYAFSDDPIVGATYISASHINEIRSALDAAFRAAGIVHGYTDTSIMPGVTTIKAAHIEEIRSSIQ